jgi:hypothetical protein
MDWGWGKDSYKVRWDERLFAMISKTIGFLASLSSYCTPEGSRENSNVSPFYRLLPSWAHQPLLG